MRNKLGVAFALFLVVFSASVVFAQAPTGTILGTVKDTSGGVVPGAKVTIHSTESDLTRTVTTSDDGAFRVPALPVGNYTVRIEKEGFQSENQTGVVLEVGAELVINSSLQVGTSSQEVTVTGEAPVVNTTNGSLGSLVNEQKMADLPLNGRNWVDLTLLQPGIEQHTNLGGASPAAVAGTFFSSNGATIRSNNYMLDGAPMIVIYGGSQSSINSTTLGVDGIREYKVVTNNFSAEYGLFMGSQTTLVSKNGTNQFHGTGFEYIRNSALDAANFFDTAQSSGTTLAGAPRRLPPFVRNNFGGSFGGPIQKDKTFFFAVYEGIRERKGLTLNFATLGDGNNGTVNCRALTANPCTTPATGGTPALVIQPFLATTGPLSVFPATNQPFSGSNNQVGQFGYSFDREADENYGQFRLDHTFSDKDTAFARYTIDKTNVIQPSPTPNPLVTDHPASGAQFTTVSETHIFTANLLNTARFSISRSPLENNNTTPEYPCASISTGCSYVPGFPQFGIGGISIGSGVQGLSPGLVVHHDQKIYTWSDDIFYTKGRNAFKFGFLGTNWKQRMELQNSLRGSLSFQNIGNFLNADYTSYSSTTPGAQIQRNWTSGTLGFYVQDDIRVSARLTVNAGVRWEFIAPNYHEVNGLGANLRNVLTDVNTTPGSAIQNPSFRDVSPRIGFAWDIFGDGKTSLRGGVAELYDVGNFGAALIQAAGATPVGPVLNNIGSSVTTVTNLNTAVTPTGIGPITLTNTPALTIPFTYTPLFIGNSLNLLQYNLTNPHTITGNLTVERQLPFGIGFSVGYVGTRGIDLMNRKEGNPCVPEGFVAPGVANWAVPAGQTQITCPNQLGKATANSAALAANGRVNPNWQAITLQCSCANSWYNSLQVSATKQLSKGLQFQGNYTFSKNLDEGSGQQSADNSTSGIDPQFPRSDLGPAVFDVTHNFRFNTIYHMPHFTDQRFLGGVVNGWWVSSIISLQSGYPFNPTTGNQSYSQNSGDQPNLVPGRTLYSVTHGFSTANGIDLCPTAGTPLGTFGKNGLYFDPCAFVLQPPGFLGNVSRDLLRGPGTNNVNFSIVKDTPVRRLGESGQVEFRAEIFNIFNHPNFSLPAAALFTGSVTKQTMINGVAQYVQAYTSGAGTVTATPPSSSREIQFALRISF